MYEWVIDDHKKTGMDGVEEDGFVCCLVAPSTRCCKGLCNHIVVVVRSEPVYVQGFSCKHQLNQYRPSDLITPGVPTRLTPGFLQFKFVQFGCNVWHYCTQLS